MSNTGTTNQQFEDLCEALRFKIKSFKRENPNLSGLQIAKIFGMASSTLNRIENRSIRTPSLDQVVKVLRGVGAHGELIEFMDEFYPAISDSFRKHITFNSDSKTPAAVIDTIFKAEYFKIFIMSVCGKGLTEDELKSLFGLEGIKRAKELIELKVLEKEYGRYVQAKNTDLSFGKNEFKKLHIAMMDNFFKPIGSDIKETGFSTITTCSIKNQETILKIKEIMIEARDKIFELVDSEQESGDVKYFISMCSDTIS